MALNLACNWAQTFKQRTLQIWSSKIQDFWERRDTVRCWCWYFWSNYDPSLFSKLGILCFFFNQESEGRATKLLAVCWSKIVTQMDTRFLYVSTVCSFICQIKAMVFISHLPWTVETLFMLRKVETLFILSHFAGLTIFTGTTVL